MDTNITKDSELPVLVTGQLEGNDPVFLYPLQTQLFNYVPQIISFWWIVWGVTLLYMFLQHLAYPLFIKITTSSN